MCSPLILICSHVVNCIAYSIFTVPNCSSTDNFLAMESNFHQKRIVSMSWHEETNHVVPSGMSAAEFKDNCIIFYVYMEMNLEGVNDILRHNRPPVQHIQLGDGDGRPFYKVCIKCLKNDWCTHFIDPTTVHLEDPRVAMLGYCGCVCCRGCVAAEPEANGWRNCPRCQQPRSHSIMYPLWPFPRPPYRQLLDRIRALVKGSPDVK